MDELQVITLTDSEFEDIQTLLHKTAGIYLAPSKKTLVFSRLARRVQTMGMHSFKEYFLYVTQPANGAELQMALDFLTTNETYFFREPKHFDYLRDTVIAPWKGGHTFRIWSAASSSGEEPYTLAMTLAEYMKSRPWEIIGSDLSTRVLERAKCGHYPMERAKDIAPHLLKKYCLRGVGEHEGTFIIAPDLRSKVQFRQINLNTSLPDLGLFDVIFIRNVMIYFDMNTKQQVMARVVKQLRPGGYLFVSHSESLNGISDAVTMLKPSIYQKPG